MSDLILVGFNNSSDSHAGMRTRCSALSEPQHKSCDLDETATLQYQQSPKLPQKCNYALYSLGICVQMVLFCNGRCVWIGDVLKIPGTTRHL